MREHILSAKHRSASLEAMSYRSIDVLIIGGGITGAGIALDAVSRGLNTGLVEKVDFAYGTSSRSTKLIHGGLRYLKQGEIKLVREVGRERAILYRNAPHIVHPEKMLLPLVKNGTYGRLATSFGLWLYDRLAGVDRNERRLMLSKHQILEAEPLIRKDIIRGGGMYFEYRTDDARLTIEVMKTAAEEGAHCVNYAEVTELIYDDQRQIKGVRVYDKIHHKTYNIFAKKIVNATGPWSDKMRKLDGSLAGKRLHLTKGVHIVVPYERLPLQQAVYFDVQDGRMIFAIPRDESTYIGTTDTNYNGDTDRLAASRGDVDYLLRAVNDMFPGADLTAMDIISTWTGLRPLIHEDGKSPSELSRKDEIFISPTGMITIAGGKLTGFRKMAERVVDLIMKQLGKEEGLPFQPCITDRIRLSGGDFSEAPASWSNQIFQAKQDWLRNRVQDYQHLNVTEKDIRSLMDKYGTNTSVILSNYEALLKFGTIKQTLLLAELKYGIEHEMVTSVQDFVIRRTGRLYFENVDPMETESLIAYLAALFGWTEERIKAEEEQFHQQVKESTLFAN